MSMQTSGDIPLLITSFASTSERRISPSWTISALKTKLEPITGIPPSSQKLVLRVPGTSANQQGSGTGSSDGTGISIEAGPNGSEDSTQLSSFPLAPYVELHVADTRPPGLRPNFTDPSSVEKYVMPTEEYEKKSDSVLAWKKAQKLGRFDPNAPSLEEAKKASYQAEVKSRSIEVGKRCRVGGDDTRRGLIKYVGEVKEIPGGLGAWVGVQLDEPVGKNNGSVGGTRYWGEEGGKKDSVFVRPERVEVGEWPVLDDLEDMEEI